MKDLLQMLTASVFYHSLLTLPMFCVLVATSPQEPSHVVELTSVILLFFCWCWGSHATAVHNMQGYGLMAAIVEFPRRIPETIVGVFSKAAPGPEGDGDTPRNRRERRAQRKP